jgi:hypothetical protein
VKMVIDEYRGQHNNEPPAELFVHAKSSFTDEEWKGFTTGAPPQTNVVGVQIADGKDNLKLFRPGKYPVVRGSALLTGDDQAFLWTAGYVPRLDTYIGPETPAWRLWCAGRRPMMIADFSIRAVVVKRFQANKVLHDVRHFGFPE